MTDLADSWNRTTAHLRAAHDAASAPTLATFDEYLSHTELELAADVLVDFGDERGDLTTAFWDALRSAYDEMGLERRAKHCRYRMYEAKHGFVEAQLTLRPTDAGGRKRAISSDYRPDWNLGKRTATGEMEISGAPVTLEDAESISPGGSGRVRLHPLWREAWTELKPGTEIDMHEGRRVVGRAVVLRVTLR